MPKKIMTMGKKKSATARASLEKGSGTVRINTVPLDNWGSFMERGIVQEPLLISGEVVKGLNIDVSVKGGGPVSQAAAIRVAVARGLVLFTKNEKLKKSLVEYDDKILSGDSRQREPYKPNDSSPRSRRQKSYR